MTIADNLILLNSTKQDIKAAIEAKGVSMTDVPFTDYDTKIGEISGGGSIPIIPDYTPWTRPTDWLTLPTVLASDDEQIIMLVRVDDTTYNELIFSMQGAYTVDWGDGTVEDYANGAIAYHNYDYANTELDGTVTSDGYKQAICKVTLQAAGTTFTRIDFNTSSGRISNTRNHPIIDIIIHSRNPTTFLLGGNATTAFSLCEQVTLVTYDRTTASNIFNGFSNLQKLVLQNNALNNITSADNMFLNCYSIKQIPSFNTTNITTANGMFSACAALVEIGAMSFDYDNAVLNNLFSSCYSIVDLRHITIANPSNLATAFSGCSSLMYGTTFTTTANCTNFLNTYYGCQSLLELPSNLDMSAATLCTSAFYNCMSLKSAPALTINALSVASLFSQCFSLQTIGTFSAPSATTVSSLFYQCFSLDLSKQTITLPSATNATSTFNQLGSVKISFSGTADITNTSSMFAASNVYTLRDVTLSAPFVNVTNCSSMFNGQRLLDAVEISTFTTNGSASTTNMFSNCYNLKKIILGGFNQTFTIAGCSLGAAELDALYTSLGTVSGKTITVSGNPGTSGDDPTIATTKGWTVVG